MKNFDLNSVDGLTRLLSELNNVIDNKINKVKLNENIKSVDTLSFFQCKQLFDNMSERLFESKNGQKYIAKYIKTIKGNKLLREMFSIYDSFITPNNINDVSLFVSESCNYINSIDNKNYKKDINEVRKVIKKALKESSISDKEFNSIVNKNRDINQSISFVFENKKTAKNMNEYTNNVSNIINYMNEHKSKETTISENKTYNDLKNIFNNDLELWENSVIEKIVLYNISNGNKETLFEEYKSKCIDLIEETLSDEDITLETKSRLSTMKGQLSEKMYKEETANEDILKLANLENTLLN
jgi:hypothetical protein